MLGADVAAEPPIDAIMESLDIEEHSRCEIRTDAGISLDMVKQVITLRKDEGILPNSTEVVDNLILINQEAVQFTIKDKYTDNNGFDEDNIDLEDVVDCETHTLTENTLLATIDLPPPRMPCQAPEDITEEVIYTVKTPRLSVFATALIIWEEQQGVTREGHRQLVEILQLVNTLEELRNLSLRKDTLRHKLRPSMPLITLRKRTLELNKTLVPSRASLKEDMLVFDMRSVLRAFLSSETNLRNIY